MMLSSGEGLGYLLNGNDNQNHIVEAFLKNICNTEEG